MSQQDRLPCFKAYDVRGRIPDELNTDLAYKIGRAYARFIGNAAGGGPVGKKMAVGHRPRRCR